MTRIIIPFLFLLAVVNGCKTDYAFSEGKSGFTEIKNTDDDAEIEKLIKPYRDSISLKMDEVIGMSEMTMETGQPESLLGNFVCDLILDYELGTHAVDSFRFIPTVVLLNFHGLRAPLPQGEIKIKNIYEIMPFENEVVVTYMHGDLILEICQFLVDVGGHPVSADLSLIVEKDKSFKAYINGIEIDPKGEYRVITTDYLANGGDKMSFFAKCESVYSLRIKLRDVIIKQIRKYSNEKKPITAKLDGRITFK